jgi:hypothetical protein
VAFAATWTRRRSYAVLTGSAVLLACVFASIYQNADIGRYYLGPILMAWTWLAILGASMAGAIGGAIDWYLGREPARSGGPPRAIVLGLVVALAAPTVLDLPRRFPAADMSGNRAAAGWVDHTLEVMGPDAVIVSWWSYSTPLWYAQRVEGRRPDVGIIDDRTRLDENLGDITDVIDTHLGRNPVYVIRDDQREIELLAGRYDLEFIDGVDARSLTRVLGARGSSS